MDIGGIASLVSAGSGVASSLYGMFGGGGSGAQTKLSKQMLKLMMAGIDDGNGNLVYYDKGSNSWKTKLNPVNKQAAGASDMENLMRLRSDMPQQRQERYENLLGRSGDRQLANTLRNRITAQLGNQLSPEDLEGDIYSTNARGINEAFDKVRGDVAATGLRTGTSGDAAIARLGETLAKSLGEARVDARLKGIEGADSINSSRMSNLLQQYGAENASANNVDNIPFNPFTLNTQLAGLASSQKAQAPQFGYTGLAAASKGNSGMADNIFDIGQNISLLLNSYKKPGSATSSTAGNAGQGGNLGNTMYSLLGNP